MSSRTVGIIGVVVLLAVFGALGGVWLMFVQPMFDQYKQDERTRQSLEETLDKLRETFAGYKPELMLDLWQRSLQPWRDAREERAKYFNLADWTKYEGQPEEGRMKKFWYFDEINRIVKEFYEKVYAKRGNYNAFPKNPLDMFNTPGQQQYQTRDITDKEIADNLSELTFGLKMCEFLLEHNVTQVNDMVLWPAWISKDHAEILGMKTVGIECVMTMRDLAKLMDDMRTADRYFSVNAIKITYPYIAYNVEPQLNISMIVSQANYLKRKVEQSEKAAAPAAGGPAGPGMPPGVAGRPQVQQAPVEEPSAVSKAWKWFKNNVLYIH
ncbi:MAG TPA: hypothetical protein PLO53_04555 [Candidatus Hydrogenedentes bacterium]|nr:hypothetical protein [Candidatus Hydrogenedentota bacterium]HPU97212.1 hypothetical protein [Candidatus Hydrogenedentota bacterium]